MDNRQFWFDVRRETFNRCWYDERTVRYWAMLIVIVHSKHTCSDVHYWTMLIVIVHSKHTCSDVHYWTMLIVIVHSKHTRSDVHVCKLMR